MALATPSDRDSGATYVQLKSDFFSDSAVVWPFFPVFSAIMILVTRDISKGGENEKQRELMRITVDKYDSDPVMLTPKPLISVS